MYSQKFSLLRVDELFELQLGADISHILELIVDRVHNHIRQLVGDDLVLLGRQRILPIQTRAPVGSHIGLKSAGNGYTFRMAHLGACSLRWDRSKERQGSFGGILFCGERF